MSVTRWPPLPVDVTIAGSENVTLTQSPQTRFMVITGTTENMANFNTSEVDESSTSAQLLMADVEKFLQKKNDEFTQLVLPAMVFLGLLAIVGVTGNSMVLYVYNRKLSKGTIRWFVQALAIFDLLSCLVAIPGEIFDMRNNYTFGSSPMCQVFRTVSMFCTVASGMTLMVVAVERYKRICTPLNKQISPKGAQVIITLCTVAASICAAPASIIYGKQTTVTDDPLIKGSDCSTSDAFLGTIVPLAFSSFQFLLFVTGAIGLVILYSLIGRKICSHARFRRVGFNTGVNRRMSYIFTGSECSSPTTDDMIFAFPIKKNATDESNHHHNNNNNNNNNKGGSSKGNNEVQDADEISADETSNGYQATLESEKNPPGRPEADATEVSLPGYKEGHHQQQADVPDKPASEEKPPSPTTSGFPGALDTFRKMKVRSSANSRDRTKSGDNASEPKGRYQRRPNQRTQSDIRRFLSRSDSVRSGTRRTTWMLFLITLVYLLSFLPYLVLMMLKALDGHDSLSGRGGAWELAHNILLRSYFINSMANPVIYSFCSRTFRKECSKVLHCSCCKSPLFVY